MPSAPPPPTSFQQAPPPAYAPEQLPWGFDYYRVKSNSNVSYDGFNGEIEYKMNASESERCISQKKLL